MTTWLENQPKVRFVQKRLRNLDELIHEEYDFVINCTGVGARFLVNDTNIRPISGHVLSKWFIFITYSEVPNRRADRNKQAGLEKSGTLLAYSLSKLINEQGGIFHFTK